LFQGCGHSQRWQGEIHVDGQSPPVKVIDEIEHPDAPTVAEPVMHEIHRPHLVERLRRRQRIGLLTHHALLRLDPQVQFEVAIDAEDPLVIQ